MEASRSRTIAQWLAVWSFAFVLRLGHLRQLRDTPVFVHLFADGVAYDAWARDIVAGHWLGTSVFYQAPLYPYFLAIVFSVFGHDLAALRVVQAGLGSVACVLLGVAATRLFGRRVGLLAAVMLAAWPSAIFADSLVQKSTLDTLLACGLLATIAAAIDAPRPARWLVPGLCLGAFALSRENALALVAVVAGYLVVHERRRRGRARAAVVWLCAGVAVFLAPVAVRNWVVGGEVYVTTAQFGPNFFIGNNDQASGGYRPLRYGHANPEVERRDATELAERALGRSLTSAEVSHYWTARALDFIRREPGRWLLLLGRKAVLFVNRVELGDAEDQYTYSDWSTLLAVLDPVLHFGVLVPLAVAGIVLTWQRVPRVFALMLVCYAGTVVATFVMARYRHPVLPLLIMFAAAALPAVRDATRRRRALALALGAAIAVPANVAVVSEASVRAGSLYNIARVLQDEPDAADRAAAYYRKAIAWDPEFALAYNNLGTLLEQRGRLDDARAAFVRAAALEPQRPEFSYNLARVEAARGDEAAAVALYEKTLALDPGNANAHTNLGALLQARGDLAGAGREYDAALASNPQQLTALNNRAIVAARQGRFDDAIALFRSALAVAPDDRSSRENLAIALAESGRHAEAVVELKTVVARAPDDVELRTRLGLLLASLGRIDEAIHELETAITRDPAALPAADALSRAYAAAGRYGDAIRATEQALAAAGRSGDGAAADALRRRLDAYRNAARN